MSDAAVSYDFEQLEPSEPPPRDAPARMLAQATEEAEGIRELARAEGFQDGRVAGQQRGAAEVAAGAAALGAAVSAVEALRAEIVECLCDKGQGGIDRRFRLVVDRDIKAGPGEDQRPGRSDDTASDDSNSWHTDYSIIK